MTGLRCRPGDIAVVIEGTAQGTFVDVLRRAPDHPTEHVPSWVCAIHAPMPATQVFHGTPFSRQIVANPGDLVCFPDRELQPIRPPAPPKEIPAPPKEIEHA